MRFKNTVIFLLMASVCKSNADKALDGSDESTGNETRFYFPPWLLIVQTFVFALLVFLLIVWSIVKCYYSCRRRCNNIEEGQSRSETEPILRPGGHRSLAKRQPTPLGRRRGDPVARRQQHRESPSTETVNTNRGGSRSNSTNITIPQRMTFPDILEPSGLPSRPFTSGSLQKPAKKHQDKSDAKKSVSQKSDRAKTNQNISVAKKSIPEKMEPAKPNQDTSDAKKSIPEKLEPAKPNQDPSDAKKSVPRIASPKKELQRSPTSIQNTSGESQSVTESFLGLKSLKDAQNGPRAGSDGLITAIPVTMTEDPICLPKSCPIAKSPVPLLHIPSSPSRNFYNDSGLRVPYHNPGFYFVGYESGTRENLV